MNGRHDSSILVREDLHFVFQQSVLNQLNPVKMKGGWIDYIVLVDTCEKKLDGFLDQHRAFWLRFLLTRRSCIHCPLVHRYERVGSWDTYLVEYLVLRVQYSIILVLSYLYLYT